MRFLIFIAAALGGLGIYAQAPAQPPPAKIEKGEIPARAAATDYQARATAGSVTIAADFHGHTIPTPGGLLSSEDYIVVEVAFYGAPDARATFAIDQFSLRVNGKKSALPSQSEILVSKSVKDPEWEPPVKVEKGGKTKIGGRGGGGEPGELPPIVHVPFELQRSWSQRVQKAAINEGDRALPQAGLIFFKYGGKTKGIQSLELLYEGPAGKATLTLPTE